jgi:hypothetical protein
MREYQPRETDEIDQKFFNQNPHRAIYLREPTVQEIFDRIGRNVDLMRLAVLVFRYRDKGTEQIRFLRKFYIAPRGFVQSRKFKTMQKRVARIEPKLVAEMRQQLIAMAELRARPQIH